MLCAARQGELGSFPRIWGLPEAEVTHDTCIAKGAETCVYTVRWQRTRSRTGPLVGAGAGASLLRVCRPVEEQPDKSRPVRNYDRDAKIIE